ncbi:solute carrier family 22 member 5 isoform X2 [Esox lucius]|uniref:solute carrier family 22 member 5 isoform X2 n=1 Tax=Esox lucius TaxID=8010 RepID=UPI0014777621|nr:solute carrier family 22 member 5 isoform X2 [Esox lucius]
MRDYDEITSFIGEWGPFQKLIFFLLSLSSIPNGYVGMAMVFVADIPPHRCRIPWLNTSSFSLDLNHSIPLQELNGEIILSRCTRFKGHVDSNTSYRNQTEGCLDGWEFSQEQYTSTIVTEWDLVCDDAWKAPFTVTIFFLGVVSGSFFSGIISDRYGRRLIFFVTMAVQTIFSILQATSNSWEMFCVFYFISGMGQIANYCSAIILGSELLIKNVRVNFALLGVPISYALGYTALPIFAWFIRSWRILLIALSLPGFLYIPLWWYVPESPQWLLSQGRVKEAEDIIRIAAKKNGITPPDCIFQQEACEQLTEHKNKEMYSWLDLVKTRNIRNITFIVIAVWVVISMTYYGMSLNTANMEGDPYLNCLVAASSEFLGYGYIWVFVHYVPRRCTLPCTLILSGIMLLLVKFIPEDLHALYTTLVMIGKTGVTGAFGFLYLYSTELFPTVVRNMALGATSMSSRLGSTVSPYIAYMASP